MRAITALVALCLLGTAFAAAPPAKVPAKWQKLIDDLGSDHEETWMAASKELSSLGEDVLGPLRAAAKNHNDVDARLRATVLVQAIERKVYGVQRTLSGHKAPVINFALSPDGKRLVS